MGGCQVIISDTWHYYEKEYKKTYIYNEVLMSVFYFVTIVYKG